MTLLTLAPVLGLDSLVVSIPLGMVASRRISRRRLAMTFGVCDGMAMLVGAALASSLPDAAARWVHEIGPALVAFYGIYVFGLGWYGRHHAHDGRTPFFLAILLSIDNLMAGSAAGGLSVSAAVLAVMAGLISGAMAFAGFGLGALLAAWFPVGRLRFAGPSLVLAACLLLLA